MLIETMMDAANKPVIPRRFVGARFNDNPLSIVMPLNKAF